MKRLFAILLIAVLIFGIPVMGVTTSTQNRIIDEVVS